MKYIKTFEALGYRANETEDFKVGDYVVAINLTHRGVPTTIEFQGDDRFTWDDPKWTSMPTQVTDNLGKKFIKYLKTAVTQIKMFKSTKYHCEYPNMPDIFYDRYKSNNIAFYGEQLRRATPFLMLISFSSFCFLISFIDSSLSSHSISEVFLTD